jgi:hypothetical protein
MRAIHLRDCTTDREVIENSKIVRARLNALWPSTVARGRPAPPIERTKRVSRPWMKFYPADYMRDGELWVDADNFERALAKLNRIALAVAGHRDNPLGDDFPDQIGLPTAVQVLTGALERVAHDAGGLGIEGGILEEGHHNGHETLPGAGGSAALAIIYVRVEPLRVAGQLDRIGDPRSAPMRANPAGPNEGNLEANKSLPNVSKCRCESR